MVRTADLSNAAWKKSSRSSANSACVEVAALDRAVAVRDSKDPSGAVLVFATEEWTGFIDAVHRGEFDR